jgi:hypothetical protein
MHVELIGCASRRDAICDYEGTAKSGDRAVPRHGSTGCPSIVWRELTYDCEAPLIYLAPLQPSRVEESLWRDTERPASSFQGSLERFAVYTGGQPAYDHLACFRDRAPRCSGESETGWA